MEREQWMFWRLAQLFIQELHYRLVRLNEDENEIWLEAERNKRIHFIRLISTNLDWSNWLKRDVEKTWEQAERLRKHLFKKELNVVNIYVTQHPPVDDYDWVIERPFMAGSGKTKVETVILARETAEDAFVRLGKHFEFAFPLSEMSFLESDHISLKEQVIHHTREQEREERALFEFGKPFFTYLFIAVQIFMFFLVEIKGGSTNVQTLIRFGAKYNPLILSGEWWRFFTPIFLHIGILHLIMNTLALFYLGTAVERIFGRLRFLWIYLFSGFTGSVASFLFTDNLSAGASGAIFGCFGALLYIGVMNTQLFFRTIGTNVLFLIGINLVFGFTVPGIDNAGHIGGLVGGFLATGVVHFPKKRKWATQFLFLVIAAIAVTLALYGGYHADRADVINARAKKQIENREFESAYDMLSQSISQGKGDAVTYFQLAYTEIQFHKMEDAKKHLQKAIELEPHFSEAHFNLALLYYDEGNLELAKEHAAKVEKVGDEQKFQDFIDKLEEQ
ncbi:rhomboid family intramembrane serine protease [Siminovitchia sp. FSL W7-1587]|uniref:rhomboid family intramembrane serine protease n=1 Tax=Siminovitchia sp. FSL W7-1587 TaxID=2954699 RepID=UPI0030CC422D